MTTKKQIQEAIDQIGLELEQVIRTRNQLRDEIRQRKQAVAEVETEMSNTYQQRAELEKRRIHLKVLYSNASSDAVDGVYQSQWGYHPCTVERYRKLKFLRSKYFEALRKHYAWNRWSLKHPSNRVNRQIIRNDKGQKIGSEVIGSIPEPPRCSVFSCQTPIDPIPPYLVKLPNTSVINFKLSRINFLYDYGILEDYNRCLPKKDLSDVQPLTVPEVLLDRLIAEFQIREKG